MKKSTCQGGARVERKTVEKNRRMHMKSLCFKLSSLIPRDNISKDTLSQQDHLEEAATYIKTLRERIEKLSREKKKLAMSTDEANRDTSSSEGMRIGFRLPVIEIRDLESILEVVLICGLDKRFLFYEAINVLEEEGAEVVNASFSTVGDKLFYTIHSQVNGRRTGLDASRVLERLKEIVH